MALTTFSLLRCWFQHPPRNTHRGPHQFFACDGDAAAKMETQGPAFGIHVGVRNIGKAGPSIWLTRKHKQVNQWFFMRECLCLSANHFWNYLTSTKKHTKLSHKTRKPHTRELNTRQLKSPKAWVYLVHPGATRLDPNARLLPLQRVCWCLAARRESHTDASDHLGSVQIFQQTQRAGENPRRIHLYVHSFHRSEVRTVFWDHDHFLLSLLSILFCTKWRCPSNDQGRPKGSGTAAGHEWKMGPMAEDLAMETVWNSWDETLERWDAGGVAVQHMVLELEGLKMVEDGWRVHAMIATTLEIFEAYFDMGIILSWTSFVLVFRIWSCYPEIDV